MRAASANALGDADALAYIAAVEAADGQVLESAVKAAINTFVIGCKADGIWTSIKASCILAGARTLTGCLVPLVGTAPTNNNFVSGDYDRKTGLVGNGSTKYLNSSYAASSHSNYLSNTHFSLYRAVSGGFASTPIGVGNPSNAILVQYNGYSNFRVLNGGTNINGSGDVAGFMGASRSSSTDYISRYQGVNATHTVSSSANTGNVFIFARNETAASLHSSARIAFYSIGESLDLALLDTRVTTLINSYAAAIP